MNNAVLNRRVPVGASYLAVQKCREWLESCLDCGWQDGQLDALEALWWAYHDDQTGMPHARSA